MARANIADAIINLLKKPIIELNKEYVNERNRANNMGEALEEYIKDLFAGTLDVRDVQKRMEIHEKIFSYHGNQNNPPDFMIKSGDAVEVKKIESPGASIALNSSYPKHKLQSDSEMITQQCRECESWDIKDLLYAIGVVGKDKKTLRSLVMVYGEDYAAEEDIYERIRLKIKEGVTTIGDIEFEETRELGRVNRVDPLGITYLRIRGMWGIQNPFTVFNYIFERDEDFNFNFMAIINEKKWEELDNRRDLISVVKNTPNAEIFQSKIKDSNNPAKLKKVIVVTFKK